MVDITEQPAIRLCGRVQIVLNERVVTRSLPGRQGRLIVGYLACNRGRSVTRQELIDLLWPLGAPAKPKDVLDALLSKVRRAVGAGVLQGRGELTFELPQGATIDLELAAQATRQAEIELVGHATQLVFDRVQGVDELLAGEFLPGHAGPWVDQQRRDVVELRLRALECVARGGLSLGGAQLAIASTAARGLITAEPLRERGYRLLMDVLVAGEDISAALQTYEQLRVTLRDELGVVPSAAIRALHRTLLEGTASGGGAVDTHSARRVTGLSPKMRSRQVLERSQIVASKLSPPLMRPGIIDRPTLIDGLLAAGHASAVLVSAPAGYGKTTLLGLWRMRDERPFAWVSIDAGDNDPVALLRAVIGAVGSLLELDDEVAEALAAPEPPIEEFVLPSLVNACSAADRDCVLVLDDLQLITSGPSLAVIEYLLEHLPAGCQLVLATRTEPALPLARLRAHGRLAEIHAAELSLRVAEARALLDAAGVHLSHDQTADLVERTEGWPAAIYLAALSWRQRPRFGELVDQFTGGSRYVADFLTEEVLAQQPDKLTDFLLRTSVLAELTGSLCNAVTGGSGADATLRELERTNLFLVPLDTERLAYRYHHLFAEYLRTRLRRRDPEFVRETHRRAWCWYRENGLIGRAVSHAHASGDVEVAAEMVAATWLQMSERGHGETLRSWITAFRDTDIEAHAPLAIAAAWVSALTGDTERFGQFATAAQHGHWDAPMPDRTASLESALAIMSSAFGLGGLCNMRAAAKRAVELEPQTSVWRPLALFILGVSETLQGDFQDARAALTEAVRLAGANTTSGAASHAYLAVIALHENDIESAWRHAQQSYATVERPSMRNYLPSICTYGVVANLQSRRGNLEAAATATERVYELLPRLNQAYWWQMIETRIRLTPVLAQLGRPHEAASRLEEAATLLSEHDDAGALPEWHLRASRELHDHHWQDPDSSLHMMRGSS